MDNGLRINLQSAIYNLQCCGACVGRRLWLQWRENMCNEFRQERIISMLRRLSPLLLLCSLAACALPFQAQPTPAASVPTAVPTAISAEPTAGSTQEAAPTNEPAAPTAETAP